ncbi:MAG: redoxin family protein [Hyphomonas sp.]|nr:redoxin family protein [Hyphomonas sp.]
MKRWLAIVPVGALVAFGVIAAGQLINPKKGDFERNLRGAPTIAFATLDADTLTFSPSPTGGPIAVNLFASWCAPCEAEHEYISELSAAYPGQVFGVLYKDKLADGLDFLDRLGNPYTRIAVDPDGQGGLEFGLTGVPETFVISADGEIIDHVQGPLDPNSVKKIGEALKGAPPE